MLYEAMTLDETINVKQAHIDPMYIVCMIPKVVKRKVYSEVGKQQQVPEAFYVSHPRREERTSDGQVWGEYTYKFLALVIYLVNGDKIILLNPKRDLQNKLKELSRG